MGNNIRHIKALHAGDPRIPGLSGHGHGAMQLYSPGSAQGYAYPATSNRSDSGGWPHISPAPAMAAARSGLAPQAS